jgi:NADH dehydrogenase
MQRAAGRSLARRRVDIWLKTKVTAIEPPVLQLQTPSGSQALTVDVVIGTTGTQPHPWLGPSAAARPSIQPTLQLPAYPHIFVVGDQAVMPWQHDRPAPPTAQAAYQAAATVADNVLRSLQGRSLQPFRYKHLGEMMTLGRHDALVASAGLVLQGRMVSCLRQLAYTYRLPPGGGHRWRVVGDRLRRFWQHLWL